MKNTEIFELLTANPGFYLATVEGEKPHVRGMFLYKADENGIVFHTVSNKDVFKQLVANPNVELCFSCGNYQIRVSGQVSKIEDKEYKDEIVNHPTRGFLKAWKEKGVFHDFYEQFGVFVIKNGKAQIWTMETNFAPKIVVTL